MLRSSSVKVVLFGFGYWGPNLARVISRSEHLSLSCIVDVSEERRSQARKLFPGTLTVGSLSDEVLAGVEIVAIATPPATHEALSSRALEAGKHVFVEKPFTLSSADASRLLDLARRKQRLVHVDFTYLYTPEIAYIKSLVQTGALGSINYVDSVRINLGLFQQEANVVWDLAVHDFAIVEYLFNDRITSVQAQGVKHTELNVLSAAFIVLRYASGLIVNLHESWMSPTKVRRFSLLGSRQTVIFDDSEADLKIKIYDSAVNVAVNPELMAQLLVSYRLGDVHIPRLPRWEALEKEWSMFVAKIQDKPRSEDPAVDPIRVLKIAEAVNQSIEAGGSVVEISLD